MQVLIRGRRAERAEPEPPVQCSLGGSPCSLLARLWAMTFTQFIRGWLSPPEGMWLLLPWPLPAWQPPTLHSESPCGCQVRRRRELLRCGSWIPSSQLCFLVPELPLPLDSHSFICKVGAELRVWAAAFCSCNQAPQEGAGAGPIHGWKTDYLRAGILPQLLWGTCPFLGSFPLIQPMDPLETGWGGGW